MDAKADPTTRALAKFVVDTTFDDLPEPVRQEGPRAFLNWLGCVYGGMHDIAGDTGYAALSPYAAPGEAPIIGRGRTADPVSATFFNVLSSCTHAYDDAHLASVAHPSGPAAGPALVLGQLENVSGREMLNAMLLGIEVQCRVSLALVQGPHRTSIGFYMTGLTGALGAAATAGKLLGLDEERMGWALGLAAAQGGGFRETHASMANALIRAQAARNGVTAALLARGGFTCTETALEGDKGFFAVFSARENHRAATQGLGSAYELLNNSYKPYPGAMPINPIVDAALELAGRARPEAIERVDLSVSALAGKLAGRETPADAEEARNSLYHWAAAAIVRGKAGLAEAREDCVTDPAVVAMRARLSAEVDPSLPSESARLTARLTNGETFTAEIPHGRGTALRPMTDAELEEKFREQVGLVLPAPVVEALARECWALASDAPLSQGRLLGLVAS